MSVVFWRRANCHWPESGPHLAIAATRQFQSAIFSQEISFCI
jgi:hypothetical protein